MLVIRGAYIRGGLYPGFCGISRYFAVILSTYVAYFSKDCFSCIMNKVRPIELTFRPILSSFSYHLVGLSV